MRALGRRIARWAGFTALGLGLLGMGSFGGGGRSDMMTRDFHAVVTDVDGARVALTRVNVAGEADLEGDLGRGRLRVPFDNIRQIQLEPAGTDRDRVRAQIVLREGEPVSLALRAATTFSGQTPSGAYQIRVRDLRSVDFEPK